MTHPSDIDGLSERLRFDAARCEVAYSKGVASNIDEAATALDSLTARVKELEAEVEKWHRVAMKAGVIVCENGGLIYGAIDRALRAEQQRDEAVTALRSVSTQCDNVIFNCEQRPADNERHLSSWRSVKASADSAIRRLASGPEGGSEGEK